MMKEPSTQLKVQNVLHDQQDEGSNGGGRDTHQHQKPEAKGQNQQEIDVAARNDLVDRNLHAEGSCQDQDLQDNREHEDLEQRMPASAQLRPEYGQGKSRALVAPNKSFHRRKLQSDSCQMIGSFSQRERPRAGGWIVNSDRFTGYRLEDHEVAHVPVQDCRQAKLAQVPELETQRPARQV